MPLINYNVFIIFFMFLNIFFFLDFCDDKIEKILKKNPSFTKQSSTKLHDNLYLLMVMYNL